MKTTKEIRSRVNGVLVQEMLRRITEASKRLPHHCKHNHRHLLDTRKQVDGHSNTTYNRVEAGGPTLGLCMVGAEDPENWLGDICEDAIDAQRCSVFEPHQTASEIYTQFEVDLNTVGWVEEHMPNLAALYWILGEQSVLADLSWWKRWWIKLFRVRVKPPTKHGLTHLLPKLGTQHEINSESGPET